MSLGLVAAIILLALGAGCSKEPDSKETRLSRAREYLASDQYVKAEKEYREVLRLAESEPEALLRLGLLYQEQGQWVQAYPLLKRHAELQPNNPQTLPNLGQVLVALGHYAEARDLALLTLDSEPGHEKALVLLADTAVPTNSLNETRSIIERRRSQDRDRSAYHLALGTLDLRQRNETRAEGEFKTALEMDPKSISAHEALGILYWGRNDLKLAEKEFKAAAELAPVRSASRLRYVDFLLKTGSEAEAKGILDDLNRKLPDYLPPRVFLMRMACAKQRDEDCAARVQDILSQNPVDYDALYQDGILNLAKGDANKAIREYEQLSNLYTKNPQARYQLALAYLQFAKGGGPNARKAVDNAETNLGTVVKLAPQFAPASLLLAELKMRKGSPAAAVDLLVPLVRDQPKISQAHQLLASAYLAQQNSAQALAIYRRMTELFPQDAQPLLSTGMILFNQRKLPDARNAFEKAAQISPNLLVVTERLVDVDLAEQKFDAAAQRVQEQLDKDPKVALTWAIRSKVYLAQRDFTRAEADLLKAIDLDPNLEPAYLLLAQTYVALDKPQQAAEKLSSFVQAKQTVPALMLLAEIQQRLKNFPAARDAYEKVLAVASNHTLAINNLAVLYSEQFGELEKAYDLAKKAREAAPSEPHLADTLGWIMFKKGDYRSALQLLRESAAKLPDRPEIQYHLGMIEYMLGQEETARTALKRATDATVDFAGKDEARRRLAVLATPTVGQSRAELERLAKENPNDPGALFRLARLLESEGAIEEASKIYTKILDGNSLYAPAVRQQAILYGQREDPKAFDLLNKARQASPDDPEIAKWLGVQNYRREYYGRAADLLKEAAGKRSDDAETLYYLGESQRQLKQWAGCKTSLERALSLNLPASLADKAKSALAECSDSASP